jgi:hypothetical protein
VRSFVLAVPTELAAGRYPAPAWAILALGGAVVVGAAVYLGLRLRRGSAPPPPPGEKR